MYICAHMHTHTHTHSLFRTVLFFSHYEHFNISEQVMNQQFLIVIAKIILTVQDGIKDLRDNTVIILLPKVIGVSFCVV